MLFRGQPQREGPVYVSVPVASYGAACTAVQGILSALVVRERTSQGQWVQASLLQGVLTFDPGSFLTYQLHQRDPARYPLRSAESMASLSVSTIAAPCKDGRWIQFAAIPPHLFWANMRAIGLGDIMLEPRFQDAPQMHNPADAAEFRNLIFDHTLEHTSDEWVKEFNEVGDVCAEIYSTTQEALNHPQIIHNGQVIEIEDPEVGKTKQVGPLALLA